MQMGGCEYPLEMDERTMDVGHKLEAAVFE